MVQSRRVVLIALLLGGVGYGVACSSSPDVNDGGTDATQGKDSAPDVTTSDVVVDQAADAIVDASVDACTAKPCVTQIAAGYLFECARLSDGTVRCWGWNGEGALGRDTGDAAPNPVPAAVTGLSNIVQVAAGFYHACALRNDNRVFCWGSNNSAQLGPSLDSGAIQTTAVEVTGIPGTIASIHMGGYFSCAHLTDKRVFCWGDSSFGQLGGGTLNDAGAYIPLSQPTPVEVTVLGSADELNSGDRYNCVRAGGSVSCVGDNDFDQLGRGDAAPTNYNASAPVIGLSGVTRLFESEAYHACALTGSGVSCWGYNSNGQTGIDPADAGIYVGTPNAVSGLTSVADLSAGGISTCALTAGGTIKCWGSNLTGEMALPPDAGTTIISPVDISGLTNVVQVAAGHQTICALIKGGTVECWGANQFGELGRNYAADGGPADAAATYSPQLVSF